MSRARMRRGLAAVGLLLGGAAAEATTLTPIDAAGLVDGAELIFIGVAVDRQVATSRDGRYPYTFFTFEVEEVLKGAVDDRLLTLRFEGGEIGDEYIEVHGIPTFERYGRYLLFVADNGEAISPVVGWEQGKLEFVDHPSRPGDQVLLDRRGQAVQGIGRGRFLRTPVVRDGNSVRRAAPVAGGITVLEEEGVVISDPGAAEPAEADAELVPASAVLQGLGALIAERASAASFRPGRTVRSLTLDDVPDRFILRPATR